MICNDVPVFRGGRVMVPVAGVVGDSCRCGWSAPGVRAFSARGAGFQRNTGTRGDYEMGS